MTRLPTRSSARALQLLSLRVLKILAAALPSLPSWEVASSSRKLREVTNCRPYIFKERPLN